MVPVVGSAADAALAIDAIVAARPVLVAKRHEASTFGPMLPAGNSPASM